MIDLTVKIINRSNNALPEYETPEAAGMDVRAYLPDGPVILKPGERTLIPTGLYMQMPKGVECQVRSRSGLSLKHGIVVLNSPGTVDADYRGEVGVILINLGQEDFKIESGDRVAQFVFAQYLQTKFNIVAKLSHTERGDGAFGHSGLE